MTLDRAGIFVAQLFGTSLLGFGTLNWWARRGYSNDANLRPVVSANLVADGLGFGLTLLNQIFGWSGVNVFGWFTVAVVVPLFGGGDNSPPLTGTLP